MPTGYTVIVEDNDETTFAQYLWRCARGMGAFILARDEDLTAQVPLEFKPSDTYAQWAREARAKIEQLNAMTTEQCLEQIARETREAREYNEKSRRETAAKSARYDRMRAQVEAWEPPTSDHQGLKNFMLEQLSTGWPDYCREPYEQKTTSSDDPVLWKEEKLARARLRLEEALKLDKEEQERARQRNEWIAKLHAAVPWVPQPDTRLR